MAVELRCPDCRAKLRLKDAPDAGTEVECPKCGTIFPAPEPEPEPEEEAPKEKAEKKEKKAKKKKAAAAAGPSAPKKRKVKKHETNKVALFGVVGLGVVMLLGVGGMLIWYFTRTSKSVEMMFYVPEDAQIALGMNLGHAQKYPEFYKSIQSMHAGSDYKAAGDAIAKAAGRADMDALVDYMLKAESSNGSAIVFRTKEEFDDGALAKLGGEKKSLDGKTYYLCPSFLGGGDRQRVFSPTNRLIVITPESTKEPTFKKMISGHGDNKEKTLGMRMGDLGKRVTRGTFWTMWVFDNEIKGIPVDPPPAAGAQGGDDSKAQWNRTIADTQNGARGVGFKASLGSREVRFEIDVWYKDSEKSSGVARKWKEGELGKGDEGTPPRWFKDQTNGMGDRKVQAQLLSNIGFGASGEVFYAKSSVETVDFQQSAGSALGKVTGVKGQNPGTGGAPSAGPAPKTRRRRFGLARAHR